ncbi:MAG: DUF6599 family protein [Thermodesulfobacteriota bacterium]
MSKNKTTPGETILSLSILCLLSIIAAGFIREQFRFSSAVTPASEELISGKTGLIKEPFPGIISRVKLEQNLIPLSPPELFDPKNLSDKINGKADFYLQAGFVSLETQRVQIKSRPEEWMEIYIYEMEKPENAFGVFSTQRRKRSDPSDITLHAYQTLNAFFFAHGPYYVELILSKESPVLRNIADAWGRAFIQAMPIQPHAVKGGDFFPKLHLDSESLEMIPANAFGFEKLNQVWTARYQIDALELSAFVSRQESISEARSIADAYAAFIGIFGAEEIKEPMEAGIRIFSVSDMYEVIFSQGIFFGGIHQAQDKSAALELAREMKSHLKEVKNGD